MTTESQPLRQRLKNIATEAVLDAAEKVMIDKGFEKATMQDIATAAGCAVGTLYVHFKNKEELFSALIQRHAKEIRRQLDVAFEGVTDPVEKLRRHIEVHLRYTHEHYGFVTVFCTAIPMRYYDFQRRIGEILPDAQSEFRTLLLGVMREAQAQGAIRTDISTESLWAMVDGFLLNMVDQFNAQPDRYTLEEQIRLTWEFIAGGIQLRRRTS